MTLPIRRTGIGTFLAALMMVFEAPAHSADWLPITPEDLQMTKEPKAPGAAAIYLYRQVDRDDNGPDSYFYSRVKILTEEGRKYGDVEIPFNKGTERVTGIEARTIRPDGSIVKFDGTVYEKPVAVANSRGTKLLAKTFTLPEVLPGCIVEYRYRLQEQVGYVFDSHWILSQELFTRYGKFSLVPYPEFGLQWSWPQGLPQGSTQPVKDRGKIRLEVHDVPAFVTEQLMPPANELKYRVDFIYLEDLSPQTDPVKFWAAFDKTAFKKINRFVDEPKAMQRAVAEIVDAADSPEVKLRKIYARVVQMHNTSFDRQKSEEETKRENVKSAHDVEDVWNRKSGDSFELTFLFLGLTRAAGLQADLALISTRDRYFFQKRLMNPRQLNSNLVIVTLDGKDLFLDPGVPFTPFGLLPWYETGVAALRLNDKGGTWLSVPMPPVAASRIERKAVLKMNRGGALSGKLTIRYTGLEAAWRRVEERNEDDTDRKQFLEAQIRGSVPSGIDVKLTNTPDWNSAEEPLVVEYDLEVPGWAATAGQRQLLKVGLFGNEDDRTFEHMTRIQPMYWDFPYQRSDDIVIEMPAGSKISSLPKSQTAGSSSLYNYNLAAEAHDNTVHLKRDFSINMLLVEAKYYPTIRDFFQTVRTGDEEQVVVARDNPVAQN